jgi:hypothetical protein
MRRSEAAVGGAIRLSTVIGCFSELCTACAVYEWFAEGFDTVDLQEVKALLETLR